MCLKKLCYYLRLLLSRFSRVWLCVTPQTMAHQAPRPWNSPGKNTGVGCHFPLQCMKVKRESEVAQSCPTLRTPMDCSLPGSSSMGFSRQECWSGVPLSYTPIKEIFLSKKIIRQRNPSDSRLEGIAICKIGCHWMKCIKHDCKSLTNESMIPLKKV